MRALWTETEAEYHGEHANLERSWSWPKPAQPIDPGAPRRARPASARFEAIVEWADGWMPGGSHGKWIADRLGELRRRWIEAGRSESGPIVWPMQEVVDDDRLARPARPLRTSSAVDQVVLDIPTAPRDEILPLLDRYAKVIATRG